MQKLLSMESENRYRLHKANTAENSAKCKKGHMSLTFVPLGKKKTHKMKDVEPSLKMSEAYF